MVYQNVCQIIYFCLLHDKIIFRLNIFNLKSQTKIVGTLLPYAYFFLLLAGFPILPMLFIAVNSPNLAHRHWEGKKTATCPNNFN